MELVNNLMGFVTFSNDASKHGEKNINKSDDSKSTIETPFLILIPAGLMGWVAATHHTPWEIHGNKHISPGRDCRQCPTPALKTPLYWCLCAAQLKWWGYRLSASYSTKSGAVEIQPNHNQMAPRPTEDNNWGSRCSSWNVSIPCHTLIGGSTKDLCLSSEKSFLKVHWLVWPPTSDKFGNFCPKFLPPQAISCSYGMAWSPPSSIVALWRGSYQPGWMISMSQPHFVGQLTYWLVASIIDLQGFRYLFYRSGQLIAAQRQNTNTMTTATMTPQPRQWAAAQSHGCHHYPNWWNITIPSYQFACIWAAQVRSDSVYLEINCRLSYFMVHHIT